MVARAWKAVHILQPVLTWNKKNERSFKHMALILIIFLISILIVMGGDTGS